MSPILLQPLSEQRPFIIFHPERPLSTERPQSKNIYAQAADQYPEELLLPPDNCLLEPHPFRSFKLCLTGVVQMPTGVKLYKH